VHPEWVLHSCRRQDWLYYAFWVAARRSGYGCLSNRSLLGAPSDSLCRSRDQIGDLRVLAFRLPLDAGDATRPPAVTLARPVSGFVLKSRAAPDSTFTTRTAARSRRHGQCMANTLVLRSTHSSQLSVGLLRFCFFFGGLPPWSARASGEVPPLLPPAGTVERSRIAANSAMAAAAACQLWRLTGLVA
jgi:hypothetical protein